MMLRFAALLPLRNYRIGLFKHGCNHSRVRSFCGSGQLIKRQSGDTVYKDVVFVTPVEFIVLLDVLIRCSVYTEITIRVGFRGIVM